MSKQGALGSAIDALYSQSVPAHRTGALFSAFPYPTKISPETVALYIATHTKPGDTILDVFGGSGTTAVAALLCSAPSAALLAEAERLGIEAQWGTRNSIIYELSELGSFVARNLTSPPDPTQFAAAANDILDWATQELGWLYSARDPDGCEGEIRHIVWTEHVRCPSCLGESTVWDGCVSLSPAKIAAEFSCPVCSQPSKLAQAERIETDTFDDVLDEVRRSRRRSPAWIYGRTGNKTWSRSATDPDRELVELVSSTAIPESVPIVRMQWGDLYRRGYHQGITHLHHFYTRRNLIVFASLWQRIDQYPVELRESLKFWLLSYNASHSTLMTRVVAKQDQNDLAVTSGQPGVLYISGLPVEKNIIAGIRRKLKSIREAFEITSRMSGGVQVVTASSTELALEGNSIDYVFTDPPFGGNIPYAEVNFLNEAWLTRITQTKDEIIVSPKQGKSVADYQDLMTDVFREVYRVLKTDGKATVIFHSATAAVWNALRNAYEGSGFHVERASVLDKLQGSFKQVTTSGSVKGDPALLLSKDAPVRSATINVDWRLVAHNLIQQLSEQPDANERSPQRLYSRLVAHYLTRHQAVPVNADSFYQWLTDIPGKYGSSTDRSDQVSAI